MGIDPDKYFGRVLFTGSHDANALAVANKRVDAATIADRIFDAAVHEEPGRSARRSTSCGAPTRSRNRRRCGARTCRTISRQKIKTAFLNIKDITWADQGKLNRFVETNDKNYDVIRDTAKVLNLDLSKMK